MLLSFGSYFQLVSDLESVINRKLGLVHARFVQQSGTFLLDLPEEALTHKDLAKFASYQFLHGPGYKKKLI